MQLKACCPIQSFARTGLVLSGTLELPRQYDYVKQSETFLFLAMSDSKQFPDHDDGLAVQEAEPRLKKPPLYKVILLNDDFTPMDFVIEVLINFFAMPEEKATQVMLHIHTRGIGVCGVFTQDVAETKVMIVNEYSREHQHPLLCSMEKA